MGTLGLVVAQLLVEGALDTAVPAPTRLAFLGRVTSIYLFQNKDSPGEAVDVHVPSIASILYQFCNEKLLESVKAAACTLKFSKVTYSCPYTLYIFH